MGCQTLGRHLILWDCKSSHLAAQIPPKPPLLLQQLLQQQSNPQVLHALQGSTAAVEHCCSCSCCSTSSVQAAVAVTPSAAVWAVAPSPTSSSNFWINPQFCRLQQQLGLVILFCSLQHSSMLHLIQVTFGSTSPKPKFPKVHVQAPCSPSSPRFSSSKAQVQLCIVAVAVAAAAAVTPSAVCEQ